MRERLNEEIKRRTRVVRIFPNAASCLRLVRALCADTHEGWLEDHRSLHMEFLKEQKKELRLAVSPITASAMNLPLHNLTYTTLRDPAAELFAHLRTFGFCSPWRGQDVPSPGCRPLMARPTDTPAGERRCPWRPGKREGHVSVEQHHVNQRGHQPRIPVGIGLLVLPRVSIHIHLHQPPGVSVCRNVDDVAAEAGPTPMEERVLLLGDAPLVFHALGAAVLSCGLISCLSIQRRPCSIL